MSDYVEAINSKFFQCIKTQTVHTVCGCKDLNFKFTRADNVQSFTIPPLPFKRVRHTEQTNEKPAAAAAAADRRPV